MVGRENLECKSWFNNFFKEFRRRYNDLPESTRKFVWDIDDFSAPCQLISIVLAGLELTYLWVRRNHELPDVDIRCFGPIYPNEFIEISEEILSDKNLDKPFEDEEAEKWQEQSFRSFLEKELIWALKMVQSQPLFKVNLPVGYFIDMKKSIPQNGFFWMVHGDITKIDVEVIFKDIFQGASEREEARKIEIDKAPETPKKEEELLLGYSTYFYPPLWIGEFPIFDFRSKVNGFFIFPIPTTKIKYKNSVLVFNQKGLFFVSVNDRQKCIRFMNEIMVTAILLGYNFDVITDLDIGETTVTMSNGEKRNQTYPKSITRYWQAEREINAITENQIASYTQIKVDDLSRVVKIAESASINAETSDYIIFFAHANNYVSEGKYKESFLFDWLIIERYLRNKWEMYLDTKPLEKHRKKKLKNWNINNLLEELSLTENIDQKTYDDISLLKEKRNSLYHKGAEVSKKDAIKCHEISELLIRKETNIIISEEN